MAECAGTEQKSTISVGTGADGDNLGYDIAIPEKHQRALRARDFGHLGLP